MTKKTRGSASQIKDPVIGTWSANGYTGDLLISFGTKTVEGFYQYLSYGKKSWAAGMAEDTDGSGTYDASIDKTIGSFLTYAKVARDLLPPVATGDFRLDRQTGVFEMLYNNTKIGSGSLFDRAIYS